jgi:hypothetical protein
MDLLLGPARPMAPSEGSTVAVAVTYVLQRDGWAMPQLLRPVGTRCWRWRKPSGWPCYYRPLVPTVWCAFVTVSGVFGRLPSTAVEVVPSRMASILLSLD